MSSEWIQNLISVDHSRDISLSCGALNDRQLLFHRTTDVNGTGVKLKPHCPMTYPGNCIFLKNKLQIITCFHVICLLLLKSKGRI